jgi:hypothetical protein
MAGRYLDVARRALPEALPRRFGEWEPLQGRFADGGEPGFTTAWRDATSILFFTASAPCTGGGLYAGPADRHPRPVWKMHLDLHIGPLADDARWRSALRRLFVLLAEEAGAFFASAEVRRGYLWNGRSL